MYILILLILAFIIYNNSSLFFKEDSNYSHINFSKPLKGGEPFERSDGNNRAILFIHGFPGSPKMFYMVRELALEAGYDVFCPKIPGFCSCHDDFILTNFSMWFNYLKNYYIDKRKSYDQFYIIGNSMGGAMTLKLAELFSADEVLKPTAIATVAAPVYIRNPKLFFIRTIKFFKDYIPPKKPIKDKSLDEDGETEWVGYYGHFPKQIFSLIVGFKGVKRDLKKITVPCYLSHAKEDKTVPFKNMEYISRRISSNNIQTRVFNLNKWKHSNHSMFIYKTTVGPIWSGIDNFFNSL
ncbi:MAG: alpha/beta fold hydrolase [Spirochaetaceae bacterium]